VKTPELVKAVDAAKTDDQRLAALLQLWRAGRSPRVANAIDRLTARGVGAKDVTVWQRTAKLPGSRAKTAILLLAKKVDDPRLATLYTTWLAQGSWPAPTAKEVWTRIFDHLIALADARTAEPLRRIAAALPAFVGADHRAWVVESIERVVAKLREPGRDPAAIAACLDRIEPLLGDAPRPAADPTLVVEAVWKSPDDLDLRQVIADALLERDDPWGELISIQLRATTTPQQRTRAKALERKHGAEWLGAIGKLTLPGSWRFEKGFPITIAADRRAVPRREWEAALLAPQWSTIRTLRVSILQTPKWWITEWARSALMRHVTAFEIAGIADKRPALRLERQPGNPWRLVRVVRGYSFSASPICCAFAAGLTPAQRASVAIATTDVADRAVYVAAFT
jgi:hypothetical protein